MCGSDICLTVADNGPGIPLEIHEVIFEPFQQSGTPNGGSSLGLGIVKLIVELHGGRVSVTSEISVGTTFTVVLPQHLEVLPAGQV